MCPGEELPDAIGVRPLRFPGEELPDDVGVRPLRLPSGELPDVTGVRALGADGLDVGCRSASRPLPACGDWEPARAEDGTVGM